MKGKTYFQQLIHTNFKPTVISSLIYDFNDFNADFFQVLLSVISHKRLQTHMHQ